MKGRLRRTAEQNSMHMNEITQYEINRLVELILGRRPVADKDLLVEELGAESADIANIVAALEKRYAVSIPESSLPALRTPRDLYERVVLSRA